MLGCSRRAIVRTSFSKRRRLTSSASASGSITLIATSRDSAIWSPRYTVDMPPWLITLCRRKPVISGNGDALSMLDVDPDIAAPCREAASIRRRWRKLTHAVHHIRDRGHECDDAAASVSVGNRPVFSLVSGQFVDVPMRGFAAHVELFAQTRDHVAVAVDDVGVEPVQRLATGGSGGAQFARARDRRGGNRRGPCRVRV